MKLLLLNLLIVLGIISGSIGFSQMELPKDKVKASFSIEQTGCEAFVVAKVTVVPGWHINSNKLPAGSFSIPTQLNVNSIAGISVVSGVIEPEPVVENNTDIDEVLSYHKGTFVIKRKILITSDKDVTITGSFSFQTCNDVKCLPEYTMKFSLSLKGCTSVSENDFVTINIDEATHRDGSSYVKVNNQWYKVPNGNSVAFYKKYLSIKLKNEK
jgi:hypothetical protein